MGTQTRAFGVFRTEGKLVFYRESCLKRSPSVQATVVYYHNLQQRNAELKALIVNDSRVELVGGADDYFDCAGEFNGYIRVKRLTYEEFCSITNAQLFGPTIDEFFFEVNLYSHGIKRHSEAHDASFPNFKVSWKRFPRLSFEFQGEHLAPIHV